MREETTAYSQEEKSPPNPTDPCELVVPFGVRFAEKILPSNGTATVTGSVTFGSTDTDVDGDE